MHKLIEQLSLTQQMGLLAGFATIWLALVAVVATVPIVGRDAHQLTVVVASVGSLLMFTFARVCGAIASQRAEAVVEGLKAMAAGNLNFDFKLAGRDEFAWMAWEYRCARSKLAEILGATLDSSRQLVAAADQLSTGTGRSKSYATRQRGELEQVAAAMQQMSATVDDVAGHAQRAADAAVEADRESQRGLEVVRASSRSIDELAAEVKTTAELIAVVKNSTLNKCTDSGSGRRAKRVRSQHQSQPGEYQRHRRREQRGRQSDCRRERRTGASRDRLAAQCRTFCRELKRGCEMTAGGW